MERASGRDLNSICTVHSHCLEAGVGLVSCSVYFECARPARDVFTLHKPIACHVVDNTTYFMIQMPQPPHINPLHLPSHQPLVASLSITLTDLLSELFSV